MQADISMVTAAAAAFVRLTPFEEGICETFAAAAPP